ncbi:nucleotidyltransferase family protein [Polaribacter aquimarinus]|uniref:Glycosyl transferase n=1 Tax=Polaribacter aquimarinus TaxID=2100726 RepID=A0A2U2JD08_9FLAO|nr:nucleotidyltransferase family protein [Polaribacter aquimarinus]PWG06192.1 glycosyl transferase [Polaribacter aquimarinus]
MGDIVVLVLAAGSSSRMKSIKQLATIDNKTLLEITLEKATKITSKNTFCVLGANREKIENQINFKNTQIIINKNFEEGLSSSISKGLDFIKKAQPNLKSVLILLADQPGIQLSYLNDMINLFKVNPSKIIASKYKETYGVPALIPSIYFDDLLKIKGNKGAKTFLNKNLDAVLSPKTTTNLTDIDTLKQLKQFING